MSASAYEKLNKELNKLFDIFNKHYFNGEIAKPILVAQTNGKDVFTKGWCTKKKIWKNKETNESYFEITVCSEYLCEGIESIGEVLLHEMIHLYANEMDIKTTSRGGTYHNKNFKKLSEEHGLIVEFSKRYGWHGTKLTEESIKLLEKIDQNAFVLTRRLHGAITIPEGIAGEEPQEGEELEEAEEPKKKQSFRKYICPECNTIIRATKDVNVVCGDCDVAFELEEK